MISYKFKNGLLHKDGKPIFAFGTSYYPSYHARKVPVPEDGDRIGELTRDIELMAKAGIHIVRCAALGDVWYDEDKNVKTSTPLIDAICKRADECDIGVMIRLQGYSMNLSGYENTLMLNNSDEPMNKAIWYNFVRDSFFHKGICEDNDRGTEALAKHFSEFASVVGWQTYNEPHYPSNNGIYDYHPDTIKAYKKWLEQFMSPEEAADTEPPRSRPEKDSDSPIDWIRWRQFSIEAMTNFLNHCHDIAVSSGGLEDMTCLTTCATLKGNVARGVNFFQNAEHMDAIGITQYYTVTKPEAYHANMNLDLAESAGSIYNKPMWLVEYDARTDIPRHVFNRKTYMAIGSGCKGLMYYQWRGDHVFPDSPEGNGFGFLNCDGTPTENYDNALAVISLVNRLSDYIVNAPKSRPGVAVLHSDYAFLNADARENSGMVTAEHLLNNSWLEETHVIYRDLRKLCISPDFVRACDLEANPLGVKLVIVPKRDLLSEAEKQQLAAFEAAGGRVAYKNNFCRHKLGYLPGGYVQRKYEGDYDMEELLEYYAIEPESLLEAPSRYIHQTLKGDGYRVAVVTNIENIPHDPAEVTLKLNYPAKSAELYSFDEPDGRALELKDGRIALGKLADGAIVIIKE